MNVFNSVTCFKKTSFIRLLLLAPSFFQYQPSQAQEDSASLLMPNWQQLKVYTNLEAALQNPDSVYILDLSKKKLAEIPEEVFKFKNLLKLDVSKNKLKSIPGNIGQLRTLIELDLSSNHIKEIPPSIGNLSSLVVLNLNRNLIEYLPPEMGNLANLETLEMWDNELSGVPDEFRNLKRLKTLELRGILFEQDEQNEIQNLLPDTKIYFSPPCNCSGKW